MECLEDEEGIMKMIEIQRGKTRRIIMAGSGCDKRVYKTMSKAKKRVKESGKQKAAYKCYHCGYFHTSSMRSPK